MAAPIFNTDRKILAMGEDGVLWELEFVNNCNMRQMGVQKRKIPEDGRSSKDQITYGSEDDGLGGKEDEDRRDLDNSILGDPDLGDLDGNPGVCAICDDGGDLLFCDGECMRFFHASKRAAAESESQCESLGYAPEEIKEMESWLCPNCIHKKHQCFICGELGNSAGRFPQVFVCDVPLCGRFYHPECFVQWRANEVQLTKADEDTIIASLTDKKKDFCCPAHKCQRCGEGEKAGGTDNSTKLAKCRRCPKAYHKYCLPRKISFESRKNEPLRAWEIADEDTTVKPILIFCLDHDIDNDFLTPKRDHLKWPSDRFIPSVD